MAGGQPHYRHTRDLELKRERTGAGPLSEMFPGVSGIRIEVTHYYMKSDSVMMVRTMSMLPHSNAWFRMRCLIKKCAGGFDLKQVVSDLVKGRKTSGHGELKCRRDVCAGCPDESSISYDVSISYHGN